MAIEEKVLKCNSCDEKVDKCDECKKEFGVSQPIICFSDG